MDETDAEISNNPEQVKVRFRSRMVDSWSIAPNREKRSTFFLYHSYRNLSSAQAKSITSCLPNVKSVASLILRWCVWSKLPPLPLIASPKMRRSTRTPRLFGLNKNQSKCLFDSYKHEICGWLLTLTPNKTFC